MTFVTKSALALLLVLTPGLAMAIPVPPLTPSVSATATASGGPRRPQVFQRSEAGVRLGRANIGGPRYSSVVTPEG